MLFIEEKSPTTHYDFCTKWVVGSTISFGIKMVPLLYFVVDDSMVTIQKLKFIAICYLESS